MYVRAYIDTVDYKSPIHIKSHGQWSMYENTGKTTEIAMRLVVRLFCLSGAQVMNLSFP